MKSDISRQTFDPRKHYKSVRMQQGRVQIDADWNEESDITIYRIETEALDLIGGCGGPMHAAAFGIIFDATALDQKERDRLTGLGVLPLKAGDFLLSAGRYYVDGILCENELVASFNGQPDFPILTGSPHRPPLRPGQTGYLAYLDVWQRSITALDDSHIREVALGGPDTGTRLKTVWQVKLFAVAAGDNCITSFNKLLTANPPSSGTLSAKTESEAISPDPCIVPPGAGFRGLENQLYRIEIHNGGSAFNVAGGAAGTVVVTDIIGNNQVKAAGAWKVGQAVEIFSGDAPTNLKSRTLASVTSFDQNTGTLTLNTKITNLTMDDHPRIRAVEAAFKWSRDNGSVVTAIERIEGRDITVSHTGLDSVLGFAPGNWVEIIDDALELNGRPGQLAQIAEVDSARRLITLRTDPALLDNASPDGVNIAFHPKLRRWDGIGGVDVDATSATSGHIDIEDGVQIRFSAGNYNTGDYWMIPARTATTDAQSGKIEWPQDENGNPLALAPFGIRHHYCPLGLLSFSAETGFGLIDDCRHLFPPVTELTSLFYVSGDGQEAMSDPAQPAALLPLPQSLVAGVANGSWPVKGATVRFHVEKGNGNVMPKGGAPQGDGKTIDVETDDKGLATCDWHIDSTTQSQQVIATLRDADDKPVHLPVIFTANLSVAEQVAYNPGNCATLQNQNTVQKALDTLSHLASLYYLSGDGQEIQPGEALQPLRVLAANRCGPVQGVEVSFQVVTGSGTITTPAPILTDADGVATGQWVPDNTTDFQEVEATLVGDAAHPTVPPTKVRFSATIGRGTGGGCDVTVGAGGQFPTLKEAIDSLLDVPKDFRVVDICICLLPGDHPLPDGLRMNGAGNNVHIKIKGCGEGSRIIMPGGPLQALDLLSFTLRDVAVLADKPKAVFSFNRCGDITIEGCLLTQENQAGSFITIAHARNIHIEDNVIETFLEPVRNAVTPDKVFADVDRAVSELFTIADRREFDRKSAEVASTLAGMPSGRRAAFIIGLQQALGNLANLTPSETKSYNGFLASVSASAIPQDEQLIRARLVDIKLAGARGTPGTAIVIIDAEADTWIEDNNILGVISLYGEPGKTRLTIDQMQLLATGMARGRITFAASLANLQIRDNVIHRIDVSEELIKSLQTTATSPFNSIFERLYRRCFITDNAIGGGNNNFIMEHLALTSNSFDLEQRLDAGMVFATASINVGNFAPNDIRLFILAPRREKAANLSINVVYL
jgi:hypothetical protein